MGVGKIASKLVARSKKGATDPTKADWWDSWYKFNKPDAKPETPAAAAKEKKAVTEKMAAWAKKQIDNRPPGVSKAAAQAEMDSLIMSRMSKKELEAAIKKGQAFAEKKGKTPSDAGRKGVGTHSKAESALMELSRRNNRLNKASTAKDYKENVENISRIATQKKARGGVIKKR